MAEYIEVNGRQIRVRPTETISEVDKYGNFHRQPNHFTKGFGPGENPVEKDRYILFWAKGCHWSNRALYLTSSSVLTIFCNKAAAAFNLKIDSSIPELSLIQYLPISL